MLLSKEEERMLNGEFGEGVKIAMKLLIGLSKAFEAEKLIKITRANIAGISYENIGEEGLSFLKELAEKGARVQVPTTINPCGTDLEIWYEMGVNEEFYKKQMEVVETYKRLGAKASCSCTPYVLDNVPNKYEHVAFAESSAVIYVNSFINSYTNKESGLSALACAITGRAPYYGLHTEEGRKPSIYVKVEFDVKKYLMWGVLGYLLGKKIGNGIPVIEYKKPENLIDIKEFCGGLSASSNIGMVYFEEDLKEKVNIKEKITLTKEDLFDILNDFNYSKADRLDYFFTGCPHLSQQDIINIERLTVNKKIKNNSKLWLFASKSASESTTIEISKLKKRGIYIFSGACPVIAPLSYKGMKVGTDSIKAAHYLRSLKGIEVYLTELNDAIKLMLE
jgi:predicted aconitase